MWIYETLSHCLTFVYGAIKSQLKFNSLVPAHTHTVTSTVAVWKWEINGRSHLHTDTKTRTTLNKSVCQQEQNKLYVFSLSSRCVRCFVRSLNDYCCLCCYVLAYLIRCHSVFPIIFIPINAYGTDSLLIYSQHTIKPSTMMMMMMMERIKWHTVRKRESERERAIEWASSRMRTETSIVSF